MIRHTQFRKAIGLTEKGDNTLLIWLGKVRLDQKETTEVTVSPEATKALESIMDQVGRAQKERQKKE